MKKKKIKRYFRDVWADIALFSQRFDTLYKTLENTNQELADLRESHEYLSRTLMDAQVKLAEAEAQIRRLNLNANTPSTFVVPDLSNLSTELPTLEGKEVVK